MMSYQHSHDPERPSQQTTATYIPAHDDVQQNQLRQPKKPPFVYFIAPLVVDERGWRSGTVVRLHDTLFKRFQVSRVWVSVHVALGVWIHVVHITGNMPRRLRFGMEKGGEALVLKGIHQQSTDDPTITNANNNAEKRASHHASSLVTCNHHNPRFCCTVPVLDGAEISG